MQQLIFYSIRPSHRVRAMLRMAQKNEAGNRHIVPVEVSQSLTKTRRFSTNPSQEKTLTERSTNQWHIQWPGTTAK